MSFFVVEVKIILLLINGFEFRSNNLITVFKFLISFYLLKAGK